MVVAGFGLLPPVAGAVLQEAIDVAAILNALRVLRIRVPGRPKSPMAAADVARLRAEHDMLTGLLSRVRTVADQLTILPPDQAAIGTRGEIEVFGEWIGFEVATEPLFDPAGDRIRA